LTLSICQFIAGVDGKPDDDHCYEAGGCLHGGKCHNQCQGYWCECPDREEISSTTLVLAVRRMMTTTGSSRVATQLVA